MNEVKVEVFRPDQLDNGRWRQLQAVALEACRATFADGYDPEVYVDWNDPDRFLASHLDPNSEVGRRFNANQEYHNPRVAVATSNGEIVGWGYSQSNVSGGGSSTGPHNNSPAAKVRRLAKRLSIASPLAKGGLPQGAISHPVLPLTAFTNRNYFQLRETFALPDRRGKGVDHMTAAILLYDAFSWQPVTTYFHPDIGKGSQTDAVLPVATLKRLGFLVTADSPKNVGWASAPVRQVRMQAPRASEVLRQLIAF